MVKTLNIAHKGFSGKFPENTMLAFRKAVEAGCDGIETDLNMTKDGVIVLCHDEAIESTTNGTGLICNYTYEELCYFDAGVKFGEQFKGEKIPSLDEFFDYVKDKNLMINLELKNELLPYPGLEMKTIEKIYEYGLQDNVIISSFNHYSMLLVKQYDSKIKTGLLYNAILYNVHEYGKILKADALHPYFPAVLNSKIVEDIKKGGFLIYTYTVDDQEYMKKLINLGVDGIITNFSDRLSEVLNLAKENRL